MRSRSAPFGFGDSIFFLAWSSPSFSLWRRVGGRTIRTVRGSGAVFLDVTEGGEFTTMENPFMLRRMELFDNMRKIAERTEALNPHFPECVVDVVDFLNMGELWLAVDLFCQKLLNPNDWLVDVRLHDLLYVLQIQEEAQASYVYKFSDFALNEDHIAKTGKFNRDSTTD